VYQSAFPDYYKPVEHWEVDENTNVDVFEKIEENYPQSSKYAEAQVNVLDQVSQSYSYQRNLMLDQIRYTTKKWDHEYVDSEMVKLFSRVCAFCEEEKHVIMDCPFVPFHIRACIAKHVELQNVVGTLMDQPQKLEPKILIVQNTLRGMELGNQSGP
jgi:hypothetical protein